MKTFVKFCGLTDAEATREVPEGGAAGFVVNVPASPRNLAPEAARSLADAVPSSAEVWAVVENPDANLIHSLFDEVGVDRIQVYGTIPADLEFLEIHHLVPSLPVSPTGVPGPAPKIPPAEDYPRLHLDAVDHPLANGSPTQPDWEVCTRIVEEQPGRKIVLAGGLSPENAAAALATVHPWGLDVAVGVEGEPGRKDLGKMRAFVAAVEATEKSHA